MLHSNLRKLRHHHADDYQIWDSSRQLLCGPCFFREGFWSELPTRVTIRQGSGHKGFYVIDNRVVEHIELSFGLVPPDPGEPLQEWRKRRNKISARPAPGMFPFGSTLWNLMNYQPPLARVLVKFCQGMDEPQIAEELHLSLYNVHERMVKAVRTGQRFFRNGDTARS